MPLTGTGLSCVIIDRMAQVPKDAAAIILLRDHLDPKVFWVKRSPTLAFMGGYHAFPGGQTDREDVTIGVAGCDSADESTMRACAVRELFEETGVLLVRGAERLSAVQLGKMRLRIDGGEISFREVLEQ